MRRGPSGVATGDHAAAHKHWQLPHTMAPAVTPWQVVHPPHGSVVKQPQSRAPVHPLGTGMHSGGRSQHPAQRPVMQICPAPHVAVPHEPPPAPEEPPPPPGPPSPRPPDPAAPPLVTTPPVAGPPDALTPPVPPRPPVVAPPALAPPPVSALPPPVATTLPELLSDELHPTAASTLRTTARFKQRLSMRPLMSTHHASTRIALEGFFCGILPLAARGALMRGSSDGTRADPRLCQKAL